MIVKKIYTENIELAKDLIIKMAIKYNFRYIDIGNELHIEGTIIRFYRHEEITLNNLITEGILISEKNIFEKTKLESPSAFYKEETVIENFTKIKRKNYLSESIKTNRIIKKRGLL